MNNAMPSSFVHRFGISRFLLPLLVLLTVSCATVDVVQPDPVERQDGPKYVFYFIGDGMGMAQVKLADAVLENRQSLVMTSLPFSGTATTEAEDRYITDSAAAGTALATGHKTSVGIISKDSRLSGNLETVAEMARDKGMQVGIVSNVSIDHATPACFYAHSESRDNYKEIAEQMASSGFDYFGGGYARGDLEDGRPVGRIVAIMNGSGYRVIEGWKGFNEVPSDLKCWAFESYDSNGAIDYAIDREPDKLSLADYTRKGIQLLDNTNGFFLMVEGGKLDWACHANDGATAAHEVVDFDFAIAEALEFYRSRPAQTLIVVTADHECGGLGIGNREVSYGGDITLLRHQQISAEEFSEKVSRWSKRKQVSFPMALDSARVYFGLGDTSLDKALLLSRAEREELKKAYSASMSGRSDTSLYGKGDPLTVTLTRVLNRKAGIGWTTDSHTAIPVPVFAIGAGAEAFNGFYDNTDIAKKIIEAAGLRR